MEQPVASVLLSDGKWAIDKNSTFLSSPARSFASAGRAPLFSPSPTAPNFTMSATRERPCSSVDTDAGALSEEIVRLKAYIISQDTKLRRTEARCEKMRSQRDKEREEVDKQVSQAEKSARMTEKFSTIADIADAKLYNLHLEYDRKAEEVKRKFEVRKLNEM